MACRPKDADSNPSSRIFRNLDDSEAGKSFRGIQGKGGVPSPRSSTAEEDTDSLKTGPRSMRANEAMRLREAMEDRNSSKLPRACTFDRKKMMSEKYDDDDAEDSYGLETDENATPNGEGAPKTLSQRSILIAQLGAGAKQSPRTTSGGTKLPKASTQQNLNDRFKSTPASARANDDSDAREDDTVLEQL